MQLELAGRRGEPFDLTFRMRSAEGRYRWFMGRATQFRDPHSCAMRASMFDAVPGMCFAPTASQRAVSIAS
jgi:hypothetical protein